MPVVLAGVSAATLLGLPGPGRVRLGALRPPPLADRRRVVPVGAGVLVGLLLGPVPGLVAFGASTLAVPVVARRKRAGELAAERHHALVALAILAAELRAGRPPSPALAAAAEAGRGGFAVCLAGAAATAGLGGDVPAALSAGETAAPEIQRALAACWQVCSAAGSGLASAVERLEEGLRAAHAQRRAVEAELAGPRATATLLAVLPLAGVALAGSLGAHPLHVLLRTPAGLVCLVAGATLDALGLLWTRRLTAGALRP